MMQRPRNELCAVISGGEFDTFAGIETADFIVAADRGYRYACEQGVRVDLVVGDFDSCDYIWDTGKRPKSSAADCEDNINFDSAGESGAAANFAFPKIMQLPPAKDDSDTLAALRHCLALGYRNFRIYCALGGRLDHLISNLQAFSFVAEQGADIEVISKKEHITYLHDGSRTFQAQPGRSLSVFSLSDKSVGVSITGAVYELENAVLHRTFPIGLSNEWGRASEVKISVAKGTLIVISSHLENENLIYQ